MRFSARLAATQRRSVIVDDAPRALRIGYIKRILVKFVGDTFPRRSRDEPLDTAEMHRAFIALIREEAEPWEFDETSSWAALASHLKDCEWSAFYDFVEMLGSHLIEKDDEIPFDATADFKSYQAKVNALLVEDGIGWSLSDKSVVRPRFPRQFQLAV